MIVDKDGVPPWSISIVVNYTTKSYLCEHPIIKPVQISMWYELQQT